MKSLVTSQYRPTHFLLLAVEASKEEDCTRVVKMIGDALTASEFSLRLTKHERPVSVAYRQMDHLVYGIRSLYSNEVIQILTQRVLATLHSQVQSQLGISFQLQPVLAKVLGTGQLGRI